jgi:transcriptional regulator with XRE-family HTH domain
MKLDAKKAKYPDTSLLIQRAQDNGLTQTVIATLCGVNQSVVSEWRHGKRVARVEQIKPLLEKFGDLRITDKPSVYLVCDHKGFKMKFEVFGVLAEFISQARYKHKETIQERKFYGNFMPDYRRPKRISDPELREKFEREISRYEERLSDYEAIISKYVEGKQAEEIKMLDQLFNELRSMEGQVLKTQDEFLCLFSSLKSHYPFKPLGNYSELRNNLLSTAHEYDSQIVQINGDIIFEFIFEIDKDDSGPMWNQNADKTPWMKWVVHELGEGKFCWIVQHPKTMYFPAKSIAQPSDIWLSTIMEPDDIEGILESTRTYPLSKTQKSAVDLESMTYLMTKAFLDRGYAVEGVKVIPNEKSK